MAKGAIVKASSLVAALVGVACDGGDANGPSEVPPMDVHVSLHNISVPGGLATSDGAGVDIVLSSGVAVAQEGSAQLFDVGADVAGTGLEALAEDGAPMAFLEQIGGDPDAFVVVIGFSAAYGAQEHGDLLDPDGYSTFDLTAPPDTRLAFVMMFVQSNDTIVATVPEGIAIDREGERDITDMLALYDVGTEISEEPGLGATQAPRQAAPNTGPDEGGRVARIDGTDPDGRAYPAVSSFLSATLTVSTSVAVD